MFRQRAQRKLFWNAPLYKLYVFLQPLRNLSEKSNCSFCCTGGILALMLQFMSIHTIKQGVYGLFVSKAARAPSCVPLA